MSNSGLFSVKNLLDTNHGQPSTSPLNFSLLNNGVIFLSTAATTTFRLPKTSVRNSAPFTRTTTTNFFLSMPFSTVLDPNERRDYRR